MGLGGGGRGGVSGGAVQGLLEIMALRNEGRRYLDRPYLHVPAQLQIHLCSQSSSWRTRELAMQVHAVSQAPTSDSRPPLL